MGNYRLDPRAQCSSCGASTDGPDLTMDREGRALCPPCQKRSQQEAAERVEKKLTSKRPSKRQLLLAIGLSALLGAGVAAYVYHRNEPQRRELAERKALKRDAAARLDAIRSALLRFQPGEDRRCDDAALTPWADPGGQPWIDAMSLDPHGYNEHSNDFEYVLIAERLPLAKEDPWEDLGKLRNGLQHIERSRLIIVWGVGYSMAFIGYVAVFDTIGTSAACWAKIPPGANIHDDVTTRIDRALGSITHAVKRRPF